MEWNILRGCRVCVQSLAPNQIVYDISRTSDSYLRREMRGLGTYEEFDGCLLRRGLRARLKCCNRC
jgi:hypothetical protein